MNVCSFVVLSLKLADSRFWHCNESDSCYRVQHRMLLEESDSISDSIGILLLEILSLNHVK